MSKSKLVGLLVLGVVLVALNYHYGSVEGHSPAQAQQVQKPYLLGSEIPIMAQMEDMVPPAYSNSPSDLPDYQKFQNYVYQKWRYKDVSYEWQQNWEIIYRQGLGTPVNLTSNLVTNDIHPDLNQPGTSIVFSSERTGGLDIYSMNIDGSALTRLTSHAAEEYSPRWSADGSRIVYVSERNGVPEIFIMTANGSGQTRLTYLPALGDYEPSFSPDGTRIAYIHQMDDIGGSLWVMDADGSDAHQVTDYMMFIGHPAWSPDGSLIGFDGDLDGDAWNELGTVRPDGSELQEIFDFNITKDVDAWMGNWSSDGELIILTLVHWGQYDWQSYISGMRVYTLSLSTGVAKVDPMEIEDTGYPDWYQQDILPPVSTLLPLPEYTRGSSSLLYWDASDLGPSGIFQFKAQYRKSTESTWTDLYSSTTVTTPPWNTGSFSCGKVFFRLRAEDHAENWEAWPAGDGGAWTTYYTSRLFGSISDNRGYSISTATLALGSPAEPYKYNPDGTFNAYICGDTNYTISATHAGYGVWNKKTFFVPSTSILDVGEYYLPPSNTVVVNGELNGTPITDWIQTGDYPVEYGSQVPWYGVEFGKLMLQPKYEVVDETSNGVAYSHIAFSADGTRHAFWVRLLPYPTPHMAVYSYKPDGGEWSSPVELSDSAVTPDIVDARLAVGPGNAVSFIWMNKSGSSTPPFSYKLIFRDISETGTLSDPVDIDSTITSSNWTAPTFKVFNGEDGLVHVIWNSNTGLWYRFRLSDGTWQIPEQLSASAYATFSATLSVTNKLSVVYGEGGVSPILLKQKTGLGSWVTGATITTDVKTILPEALTSHEDGRLILAWCGGPPTSGYYVLKFSEMTSGDTWSAPQVLKDSLSNCYRESLLHDKAGNLHLYFSDSFHNYFWIRKIDGGWSKVIPISTNLSSLAINPLTQIPESMAGHNLYMVDVPVPFVTSIAQTITVPGTMINPTLSFNYRQITGDDSGVFFGAINGTTVFTGSQNTRWEQQWVDLTPWLGQTVELKFSSGFNPLESSFSADLDNVSVGEWLTPVITSVTPGKFMESWTSQVITLSGENFIDPVTVKIGDQAATPVIFIDENTLQVSLPDGLTPGTYAITVTNPEGQTGVKPSALWLGITQFLPMLIR
jgi:hypothetical protein